MSIKGKWLSGGKQICATWDYIPFLWTFFKNSGSIHLFIPGGILFTFTGLLEAPIISTMKGLHLLGSLENMHGRYAVRPHLLGSSCYPAKTKYFFEYIKFLSVAICVGEKAAIWHNFLINKPQISYWPLDVNRAQYQRDGLFGVALFEYHFFILSWALPCQLCKSEY